MLLQRGWTRWTLNIPYNPQYSDSTKKPHFSVLTRSSASSQLSLCSSSLYQNLQSSTFPLETNSKLSPLNNSIHKPKKLHSPILYLKKNKQRTLEELGSIFSAPVQRTKRITISHQFISFKAII